ncbi:MAG: CCA tRNA nucleotidyltransferase [Bryobacterales bacterium]|nr:CCA tRNA nucleotidyltransferase [Bryobacterales bacterium]
MRSQGYQAYFAGGCVRDRLLGLAIKDYDLATDATPAQLLSLYPDACQVGAHFGVLLIGGAQVATFRSDHAYLDGRHPEEVRFETDPRADVRRRDFTINGLLEDPETGEITDFVGGRLDLERRIIRAIGDPARRFEEDHLRMLRAVRFAAGLGFDIEPSTLAAISRAAAQILRISAERVRDELSRILTGGGARRGFELLDETGLLVHILPEVSAMRGVQQPPEFHPEGDVWTHTLMLLENLDRPTLTLALGALLHDAGKPPTFRVAERIRFDSHAAVGAQMAEEILKRLRYSNDEIRQVAALVKNHLRFMEAPRMKESTLKRFMRLPHFEEHLELHRLDCLASHRRLDNYNLVREKWESLPPEAIRPAPLLTGDDLIRFGLEPGPEFKRILSALEDAQLDGTLQTREQALEWLRNLGR